MSHISFKFRLNPTTSQSEKLSQIAGSCRFVFNHFLSIQKGLCEKRRETRDTSIKLLNYNQTSEILTKLKQEEPTSWLADSFAQSLQQSLMNLDKALKGWLTKKSRFPQFKKKGVRDSFKLPQLSPGFLNQIDKTVKIPKVGTVHYKQDRMLVGTIRSANISRDGDHWYISILTEQSENLDPHPSDKMVGIDVGVSYFLTLSSGTHINLPNSIKSLDSKIVSLQQRVSHKKKGSNNRKKAVRRLSTAYRKLRNIRLDFLHKTSTDIAKNHSYVVMENLKVVNMTKSARGTLEQPGKNVSAKRGLNRSIARQSWSLFRGLLSYKLSNLNGELRLVDPRYTSQTCPVCLTVDKRNRKSQSKFECVRCGHTNNADVNAANNILRLGFLGSVV